MSTEPKRRTTRIAGKASTLNRVPSRPIGATKTITGLGTHLKRQEKTPNQITLDNINKVFRNDYLISNELIQQYENEFALIDNLHILNPHYLAAARVLIGEAERIGREITEEPFFPLNEQTTPRLVDVMTKLDTHMKRTDAAKNEGNADIPGPEDRATRQKMELFNYIMKLWVHLRYLAQRHAGIATGYEEVPEQPTEQPAIVGPK